MRDAAGAEARGVTPSSARPPPGRQGQTLTEGCLDILEDAMENNTVDV